MPRCIYLKIRQFCAAVAPRDQIRILTKAEWTQRVDTFHDRCNMLLRGNTYKDPEHPIYNFIFKYYFSLAIEYQRQKI